MIRAVLDANVIASGILRYDIAQTAPVAILRAWYDMSFFGSRISRSVADQWLMLIDRQAEMTTIPTEVPRAASHAEDDLILATAVSGSAAYLVTGDRRLQRLGTFEDIAIVSPAEFLSVLSGARE